jgi:hypothetical protein
MKDEPRILWLSVLYNWKTRKKVVCLLDDSQAMQDKALADGEGDLLYRTSFLLHPPGDDGSTKIELDSPASEEDATRRKMDKDETTESYLARSIFFQLPHLLPPGAYPQTAGNEPGRNRVEITTPDGTFEVRVARIKPVLGS